MSAIIPFQFEAHAVRTLVDDSGKVWFVGKDGKNVTLKSIIAKTIVAQPVAVAAEADEAMAAAA